MCQRIRRLLTPALLLIVSFAVVPFAAAQDATRAATSTSREADGQPTVVASGLTNPRGFAWSSDGTLYVALAGKGGKSAGIAKIEDGCPTSLVADFPSAGVVFKGLSGIADVAFRDGTLYALAAGGDTGRGEPPNGVYRVGADGVMTLVADVSAFIKSDPIPQPHPPDYDTDGVPYALAAQGDGFLIVEGNGGELLRATLDGTVTRVADLSAGHPIPTGLALAPNGDAYVAFFTSAPYLDGSAKVVKVGTDGSVADYWTDLTAVTALAMGADGQLYALEMSTGNSEQSPFIIPDSGKVVRRTGPATAEEVVTGLSFPAAMDFGPDGALYIGYPAIAANNADGAIVRLDIAGKWAITINGNQWPANSC